MVLQILNLVSVNDDVIGIFYEKKILGTEIKHLKVFNTKKRKFSPIRESDDYFKTDFGQNFSMPLLSLN